MKKINYDPTTPVKQLWFYLMILYMVLRSIVSIMVEVYQVEGFHEQINLALELPIYFLFAVLIFLLSRGHKVCYVEYDDLHIIRKNRLLRSRKDHFDLNDAGVVFFDRKGIKFYKQESDITNKEPFLFIIPSFRGGRMAPLDHQAFYNMMKEREANATEDQPFTVFRSYSTLPGYDKKSKKFVFAYMCLCIIFLMNLMTPLAIIIGLWAEYAG